MMIMLDFAGAASRRTAWLASLAGLALLVLPADGAAQTAVERVTLDGTGILRPLPATSMPAPPAVPGYDPAHAGTQRIGWRYAATYDGVLAAGTNEPRGRDEASPRRPHPVLSGDDDPHPLRGTLATIGGMLAGFGVGLAADEPAPGLLVGTGVGMITTAFIRAFDD
ncbi:MAG: hypothetical protein ACODAE_06440 [Gemmatimonadota bacterium]